MRNACVRGSDCAMHVHSVHVPVIEADRSLQSGLQQGELWSGGEISMLGDPAVMHCTPLSFEVTGDHIQTSFGHAIAM